MIAANDAREAECELQIACRYDGTILALKGDAYVDVGAYNRINGMVGARNIAQFLSGPYRIPDIRVEASLLLTNKTPVGTYRGPGRFEADFFRERLFDIAARDMGIDRVEFRRRNLLTAAEMPYSVATITPYEHKDAFDSGDTGRPSTAACRNSAGTKSGTSGQTGRRPLPRIGDRVLYRGQCRRPEGKRPAGARARRYGLGLCRFLGGRARS